MPTTQAVYTALETVEDPELRLSIVPLGLIYGVDLAGEKLEHVTVTMTFTSPMCPVGPSIKQNVHDAVMSVDGVKTAQVDVTFSPPWDPREMANDDVKLMLGLW